MSPCLEACALQKMPVRRLPKVSAEAGTRMTNVAVGQRCGCERDPEPETPILVWWYARIMHVPS